MPYRQPPMSQKETPRKEIKKIERNEVLDALRGVAALGVVFCHYSGFIPLMSIPVSVGGGAIVVMAAYGHIRVPFFFVLSGYVIAMTASRYEFTPSIAGRFLFRRLVRLAPSYWGIVLLTVVTMIMGHTIGFFKHTHISVGQVAAHLVYAQYLLRYEPLDAAYWTLCLEVQFYVVFVISSLILQWSRFKCHVGWFTVITLISFLVELTDSVPMAWFPRLWYQFGFGALAYYAGRERSARLALLLMVPPLFLCGLYRSHFGNLTVAIVTLFLFLLGQQGRRLPSRVRFLLGLGQISYSLYLVHGFVELGLGAAFRSAIIRSEAAAWAAITIATIIAVAFTALYHHVWDRKSVEWSRRIQIEGG